MPPSVQTSFTLQEQLCFALYDASHAMTARYRGDLGELGLTYTQYLVMLVLWERERSTLGELARELSLDRATLSPTLKRMEQQQLLVRSRNPEDERILEITCTEAGHRLRDPARRVAGNVEQACGVPAAELARLRDEVKALARTLREDAGTAGPPAD